MLYLQKYGITVRSSVGFVPWSACESTAATRFPSPLIGPANKKSGLSSTDVIFSALRPTSYYGKNLNRDF